MKSMLWKCLQWSKVIYRFITILIKTPNTVLQRIAKILNYTILRISYTVSCSSLPSPSPCSQISFSPTHSLPVFRRVCLGTGILSLWLSRSLPKQSQAKRTKQAALNYLTSKYTTKLTKTDNIGIKTDRGPQWTEESNSLEQDLDSSERCLQTAGKTRLSVNAARKWSWTPTVQ